MLDYNHKMKRTLSTLSPPAHSLSCKGGGVAFSERRLLVQWTNGILKCEEDARNYAICSSSKGLSVEKDDCVKEFTRLKHCMERG